MENNKKLTFGVSDFSVVDDVSDEQLAIVEIFVCHDGNNLHDMPIDLDVLKRAKKTLRNKFLVAGFDGDDFEGHEPDERIVGFFPESSKMRFEEKDGKTYLVAQAIMSKIYADWAYETLANDGNNKAVSMEITVLGTEIQNDGLEHITKFVFNGVTLLGDDHLPACEGSNAYIIKFSKENALNVYSKHANDTDRLKKEFVADMKLAEVLGKEEHATMNEENKEEIITEEVESEIVEAEAEIEVEEDETTYMDEETEDDKEEEADSEDAEEEKEDELEEVNYEQVESEKKVAFADLTLHQQLNVVSRVCYDILPDCYVETIDKENVYVYDFVDKENYRYSYSVAEDTNEITIDLESKTRVIFGGYVEFEAQEKVNAELETLRTENCELKEKIVEYETAEKAKAVESILSEVVDVMTYEEIGELREEAKSHDLNDLGAFENKVKAIAFERVAEHNAKNKYTFNRMPVDNNAETKTSKYGW